MRKTFWAIGIIMNLLLFEKTDECSLSLSLSLSLSPIYIYIYIYGGRACVCVCLCVCAHARARARVCVSVRVYLYLSNPTACAGGDTKLISLVKINRLEFRVFSLPKLITMSWFKNHVSSTFYT